MTQVVLFHSALGVTEHVHAWAEHLRAEGHEVFTPDLFDGRTFDDIGEGVELVDSVGLLGWVDKATTAIAGVKGPRVYAGFSMGAAIGEVLALRDERAHGVVVMHGAVSPEWVQVTQWPAQLRAQLHTATGDPWREADEDAAFVELAGPACEAFEYDVDGHLFAFEGWREYREEAAGLMFQRVSDFLAEFD